MSAAPLPISSRSTRAARRCWPRCRRRRRTRRSASSTGSPRWRRSSGSTARRCSPRPSASSTAPRSRPTRCSNARARGTGLLTTEGHRDVIEMREGLKDDRYNLRMPPPEQLVPRHLRLGVRERMRADGRVETPLDPASLDAAIAVLRRGAGRGGRGLLSPRLARSGATSARPREALARALPDAYVSLSSEVLPQIKEFERVSTTIVNAYVGPVLSRYLARLEDAARRGRLSRPDADHPVAWRGRADRRGRPARRRRRCCRGRPAGSPAASTPRG